MFAIVTTSASDTLTANSEVTVYDDKTFEPVHARQVFQFHQDPKKPLAPARPIDTWTWDSDQFWHLIDTALQAGGWRSDPMRQRRHVRHGGCIEFAVIPCEDKAGAR